MYAQSLNSLPVLPQGRVRRVLPKLDVSHGQNNTIT